MTDFERGKAYVVDRGETRLRYGQGMAAGLGVVLRHFRDAFTKKLDDPSETSGVFTVQYPEERLKLPEAFRNFPILLYDDESGQELCTSCFQCERICPVQVIHITQAKDPTTGKPVPAAESFEIEYDACMSCGLCAEVCPFDAIKMDHEFELSTVEHHGLTLDKAQLDRPVSYYAQLAPTFWAEAKDNAYKKLQGTLKRRSGLIGLAPQMHEKVAASAAPPAVQEAAAKPADDKAARLAAIRARNAAQKAGGDVAPAPEAPPAAPADDKAARLAAIRAKNAAKKVGTEADPAPQQTPPADDKAARLAAIRAANAAKKAGTEADPAPQQTPPADDKAARLAAIRAANAAKKADQQAGSSEDEG